MAKRSLEELITGYKSLIGDRNDDDAINFLEDLNDSYAAPTEDWEAKYKANDAEWRNRYIARFGETTSGSLLPEDENIESIEVAGAVQDDVVKEISSGMDYESVSIDSLFKE